MDLTDCALLETLEPRDTLLTTDAPLVYRRLELGSPAVNFHHLRESVGLV